MGNPIHPFKLGITVILALIGFEVLLTAVNAGKLPFPFAGSPMSGLEFVQLMVAPGGVLLKMYSGT